MDGKVVRRLAVVEGLAHLRRQGEFAAPMRDGTPDPLLAQPVGRSGVDVTDAEIEDAIQKRADGPLIGEIVTRRVLRLLVPPDLEGAETDRRNHDPGSSEWAAFHRSSLQ